MQLHHNHRGFVELAMPNDLETSPPVSPALFETIPPTGLPSTERPIFSGPTESFAREFQWISWWNLKHIIATWCKNRPLRESRICPFLPYFRSTSIDSHAEIFWNIWQIWWGSKHKGQTSEVTPGMSSGRKMRSRAWAEARMGQQGNTMIVTAWKSHGYVLLNSLNLEAYTAPVFQIIRRVLLQLAGGLPGTTSCCARCVSDASGETLVQISQLPSPATVYNATMIIT